MAAGLSKKLNISESELQKLKTDREKIKVSEIIFDYIKFNRIEFKAILNKFKSQTIYENGGFEEVANFQSLQINYGIGGIHAAIPNKIFEETNEYLLKSLDVTSFYPFIMIQNDLHPEHIDKNVFKSLLLEYFNERMKYPKKHPANYLYKIFLNSIYGLTNDEFSFLKDRKVTLAVCINGQLLLTMLLDMIVTKIQKAQIIMMNTDGFEIMIPRNMESLYLSICKEWENITKLSLEHFNYQKLIEFQKNLLSH